MLGGGLVQYLLDFMWFCQTNPSNLVIKNVGIHFVVLLTVLQSEVQVVAPAAIQFYMIENGISNIIRTLVIQTH